MAENQFNQLDKALSASIEVKEQTYLYFGGTAYLGIPQNKDFIQLFMDGVTKYGLNNGTSRGNNVQLGIYNEAEDVIAKRYGAQAAMVVSSGYLAAKLTVTAYAKDGVVRYAPNAHPALWLNGTPESELSFSVWASKIVAEINSSTADNWVLVSNSMNNLYPEYYDFSFIKNILPSKNIKLIIDDSHGIGMLNSGSSVWLSMPQLSNVETVIVASMAKALGVDAGVVFGAEGSISRLKQSDEFYGASPPAAAGLYAFINGEELYKSAYQKVQENISIFASGIKNQNEWHFIPEFPVFLNKKPLVNEVLAKSQILISSFAYPDRNSALLNRIVLSSWHSDADITQLHNALN